MKKSNILIGIISILILALGYNLLKSKDKKVAKTQVTKPENPLTKNCDMTTFEGRMACFRDKITENRKRNKAIPKSYLLIGQGINLKLNTKDLNDIIQIERPTEISIKNCAANSIYFDWNQSYFFIAPDSFNSGAVCDSSKGRIAIVPSNLSNAQITEFYQIFQKK